MKRTALILLVAVASIVGILFTVRLWRHPDGAAQFKYVFGIAPPLGVKDIHAYRRYPGGIGDSFVLLRFTANRQAIDTTVASRPMELDPHVVDDRLRASNDVQFFWQSIFGPYCDYGGAEWQPPSDLSAPEVYDWLGSDAEITHIKLLWDGDTGRAYALCTVG